MSKGNVEISMRPFRGCSQEELRLRNDFRREVARSANLWVNSAFWGNSVRYVLELGRGGSPQISNLRGISVSQISTFVVFNRAQVVYSLGQYSARFCN